MKTSIIYNSYSGNTRGIAEQIRKACGGELIEVKSLEYSSRLTAYTIGCYRAMKEERDRIEPAVIDVSGSDCIVFGTPVWGGKATPAINGAIAALQGCAGKNAVLYATCGKDTGETFPILTRALEAKGMTVTGQFVFTRQDLRDDQKIKSLAECVNQTGRAL